MNTTNIEPQRALIELKHLHPWERNPRGAELRGMEAFTEQLREEGIRDDLHVFRDAHGLLVLMQGHRRRAAAEALGIEKLWCKVWPFDEGQAFLHLLTMQNGSDPFDPRELAKAARDALSMGLTREQLVGAMHRSEETVQLYLDLGTLPHRVQEAVYKGRMALGTAGLLRQLDKEQMEMALEGVMENPITREPMSEAQARVYIENQFLKPQRWAKEWLVESKKRKRLLLAGGIDAAQLDVVTWEDRESFVLSDALPQGALALCEEHIEDALLVNPAEPMTWGELARSLGVPWHLCPAPARAEKHLLLVKTSAVRDADDVKSEGWTLKGKAWREAQRKQQFLEQQTSEVVGDFSDAGKDLPVDDDMGEAELQRQDKVDAPFDLERWRRMHARLMLKPEAAMQNSLWEALMGTQWEALAEILPKDAYASLMGELNRDGVKRKGLRWCLLACVALALCAEDEEALSSVEEGLGLGAEKTVPNEGAAKKQ